MYECDNCGTTYQDETQLKHVFPDIPDLLQRLDVGGVVPAGECTGCGALAYPQRRDKTLHAVPCCPPHTQDPEWADGIARRFSQ